MPPTGIKKQKTFSHRRHISKPRAYLGSIEKEKRQSSLTQLDFVSTPQTNEVVPLSSDDDGNEDFAEEQPKKRRRVSGKGSEGDDWTPRTSSGRSSAKRRSGNLKGKKKLEKGQQTMTQIDFVPSTHRHQDVDDIEDYDDLEDEEHNFGGRDSPVVLRKASSKRSLPWVKQVDDELDHVPQSPTKSPQRNAQQHQQPDLAAHSIATHDFTTPKKVTRHLEIPSSQSPPSIKMSTRQSRKSQRFYDGQKSPSKSPSLSPAKLAGLRRTPLQEKSANTVPPRWQPETQESQNPTMKMLQQVRMRTKMGGAALHEEAPMPPPKSKPQKRVTVESSQRDDPATTKQPLPRKLQRTNTVQDSQASEENIMTQAPPHNLKRVSTIQDSQHEDLDLSSQLYRSMSSRENLRVADTQFNNDHYDEYDDEEEEEEYPHTYDPVSAALERDAARYAWTQTQAARTQHNESQIVDSEDDSDDDDLDRGIIPNSESEDEIILLPSPSAQNGPSQELLSEDVAVPHSEDQAEEPTPKAHAPTEKKRPSPSPPSSPPPLRPSQVSTVMPTQSSPHFIHLPTIDPADAEEPEEKDEEYSPPTSPPAARKQTLIKKPQYQDTQALTISSSPLPLPPWSSSGEVDLGLNSLTKGDVTDHNTGGNELASLVDFSLPPPPPLGMSSSPWK